MKFLENYRFANWFKRTNRIVQIILSIMLVVGLNYIGTRYYQRIDLTHKHRYSLSPETLAYLNEIDKTIHIFVTIIPDQESDDLLYRYVKDLLREYQYASNKSHKNPLKIEFVNIYKERQKAEMLADTFGLSQPDVVLVTCEEEGVRRQRVITGTDILEYQDQQPVSFKGEQVITSAIVEVADPDNQTIYFLSGHGEMRPDDVDSMRGLSQVSENLQMRNIVLKTLDLTQHDEVPIDADMILIASPQGSISPSEVEKLRIYLGSRAGRVMVFVDPARRHGLDELLYEWGIMTDDMVVVDTGEDYLSASGDYLIRNYGTHPITSIMSKNQIPVMVGLCRPVRMDPGSPIDERLQTDSLMKTSTESWAESGYRTVENLKYDPRYDLKGPISIGAVSERKISSQLNIEISGGRLVVFGNSDFISNQRINYAGNFMLLFSTTNWLLDRDKLLGIPPRKIEKYHIPISHNDLISIALLISVLPGVIALLGIIIHWLRKN